MTDKAWKRVERAVAERLGGRRVPITGRARGSAPDVDHAFLSIEVKHRKSLPAWLLDAMLQADASAKQGQLPITVLHRSGWRHDDDLIVMRMDAFTKWIIDGGN